MFNWCSHGTFLHFSLQRSHLNQRYYHRDLHWKHLHSGSLQKLLRYDHVLLHVTDYCISATVNYRAATLAPSIFRAGTFGRWVVTHSLANFNFHDHRPAVYMYQHLLRCRHEWVDWPLKLTFGLTHIASSAYQKWPTNNSRIVTLVHLSNTALFTHLEFENRFRILHPKDL